MRGLNKKILITAISVLAGTILIPAGLVQANGGLAVQFEQTPLFNEVNFLPGDGTSRWVKVTNNSGENQKIGVKVSGSSDCTVDFCLADALRFVISKEGSQLYADSLTNFYNDGEILLTPLANGVLAQYDFNVTFLPETGNDYQGLSTNFNFDIGFFGGESISDEIPPGGGGGGGGVILFGLAIFNEQVKEVGTDYAIITWQTNLDATSRIIYSAFDEPRSFDPNLPPNYGYSHSNTEDAAKITFHTMTINGLRLATSYYFRCVSHTSPDQAISKELTFTTKSVAGEGVGPGGAPTPSPSPSPGISPSPGPGGGITPPTTPPPTGPTGGPITGPEGGVKGATTVEEFVPEEITAEGAGRQGLRNFLASLAALAGIGDPCRFIFWVILAIAILLYLFLRKKKDEQPLKLKWKLIYPLVMAILIILFCRFCCCLRCKKFLLEVIVSVIPFIFLMLEKREKEETAPPVT